MDNAMTLEEFRTLAESFGANLLRWPEEHQAAGHRFAARTDAQMILSEVAALDAVLDQHMTQPPSDAFMQRLLQIADERVEAPAAVVIAAQSRSTVRPGWILSFAMIGLLGFGAGHMPTSQQTTTAISASSIEISEAQDTESIFSIDTMMLGATNLDEVIL